MSCGIIIAKRDYYYCPLLQRRYRSRGFQKPYFIKTLSANFFEKKDITKYIYKFKKEINDDQILFIFERTTPESLKTNNVTLLKNDPTINYVYIEKKTRFFKKGIIKYSRGNHDFLEIVEYALQL